MRLKLLNSILLMILLSSLFIWPQTVDSAAPKLLNATIYYQNVTVIQSDWYLARVDLTFDQDLYLNQGLLCPFGAEACPSLPTCEPCDWTISKNPSQCPSSAFSSCCANILNDPAASDPANLLEWCSPSEPFEVIPINPQAAGPAIFRSSLTSLNATSIARFRFVLPTTTWCSPVRITTKSNYGNVYLFYSNRFALPDDTNYDGKASFLIPTYGYGQAFVDLCPTYDPHYSVGTYAVTAYAVDDSEFYLEINIAPPQPFVPPPNPTVTCQDIDLSGTNFTCVENGETYSSEYLIDASGNAPYYQYVLPVPSGCHTLAMSAFAVYDDAVNLQTDLDLYCIDVQEHPLLLRETSLQGRFRTGPDTVTFSGCFDQPTFLRCAVQAWIPGRGLFTWSSVPYVHRIPLTEPSPYDYALLTGLSSAQLIFFNTSLDHSSFCLDWSAACTFGWTIAPYDRPLHLFPPPPTYVLQSPYETIHFKYPPAQYYSTHHRLSSTISLVIQVVSSVASEVTTYSFEELYAEGSIALTTITNIDGIPPQFDDHNPNSPPYITSFTYSALEEIYVSTLCEPESFARIIDLNLVVRDMLADSNDLQTAFQHRFELDVATAAIDYYACFDYLISFLNSTSESQLVPIDFCVYSGQAQEAEYQTDPCCSAVLLAVDCCRPEPRPYTITSWNITAAETYDWCQSPACAATYFRDLADSLSIRADPALACQDLSLSELQIEAASVSQILRSCRDQLGLGRDFAGVPCATDADCTFAPHRCHLGSGICYVPARSTIESQFLSCFIDSIPVSFEDWMKHFLLSPDLLDVPRDSPQFFAAVQALAITPDCVSNRSLDIATRNHWVWSTSQDQCKAVTLGISSFDTSGIELGCPDVFCLDSSCFVEAKQCYRFCAAGWSYATMDQESCQSNETICTVGSSETACAPSLEGTYTCAYCPPDGSLPCQEIVGPTSQQECEQATVCETPDGEIIYGLSAQACSALNPRCSIECPNAPTCRSSTARDGICQYMTAKTLQQCDFPDSFFVDDGCFSGTITDAATCLQLPGTAWQTCADLNPCDFSTSAGKYLGCFRSPWGPCTTESACTQAGQCSDRDHAFRLDALTGAYQPGACFLSGYYQPWIADDSTNCPLGMLRTPNGCINPSISDPRLCTGVVYSVGDGTFQWLEWRNPAQTKDECFGMTNTSRGCLKNEIREYRTQWRSETDCIACGGTPTVSWRWEEGTWITGQLRPLTWIKYETVQSIAWVEDALSFQRLSEWIQAYIEYRSTFAIRSTGLCKYDLFHQPISFLSCDCLSASSHCQETSISRPYSVDRPCFSEELTVRTLSAVITYSSNSIASSCASVITAEIPQSNVLIPPSRPHVSVQLAYPANPNYLVRNAGGLNVGIIVSNGIVLSPSDASLIQTYQLCIAILDPTPPDLIYTAPDFAISTSSEQIYQVNPLGVPVEQLVLESGLHWCANLSSVYPAVFAVYRKIDYQTGDFNSYSEADIAQSYTLAALFSLLLVLTLLVSFFLASRYLKFYLYFLALPAFFLLCVFRITYCYALPSDTWINDSVAGFIIFELPTFFYFSAICFILLSFIDVLGCFAYSVKNPLRYCVYGLLFLVWCLFVSVAVADGVLSSQSDGGPCPGRVPPSNAVENQLRNLSIAYQSILIFFTVLLVIGLAAVLSMIIRNTLQAHRNVKNALFSLKELLKDSLTVTLGFLLRCILFIAYWSSGIDSTPYIFVTIMVTEVFVIMIIVIWWTLRFSSAPERWASSSGSNQMGSSVSPKRSH